MPNKLLNKSLLKRFHALGDAEDSEEKRRLIMNAALDAIICIDADGLITFWNPQAEKIFGWEQKEIIGKLLSDTIIPHEYRERHEKGMKHFIRTGDGPIMNTLVEIIALNKEGGIFPIELSVVPIAQKNSFFFCAFIRDISERKKVEKELRKANERFNLVSEATNDMVWDWDLVSGKIFRAAEGVKKVYGFDDNMLIEDIGSWMARLHPDDKQNMKNIIDRILQPHDQRNFSIEYRFQQQNGNYVYILDRGYIIRDTSGKPIRMIGAAQDISERKKAELKIADSEVRYRTLFEQNIAGVYQSTTTGKIINCNEAFIKMLGYSSQEELLQMNATELYFSGSDREEFVSELRKQHRLYNYQAVLKRKDGAALYVLENISLVKDSETSEECCYGVLVDITEKTRVTAELQKSYEKVVANEALLKTAESLAHIGSWCVDLVTGAVQWSDEACRIYGYEPHEFEPSFDAFLKHIHSEDLAHVKEILTPDGDSNIQELEFRIIDKSGKIKYILAEHVVTRDDKGMALQIIGFNMDITEKCKLEEKLAQERTQRHHEVTNAIITAQEQERTQLAEELHDNINQILATARLYIECAIRDSHVEEDMVNASKDLLTRAMEEIRILSKSLVPPSLGQISLDEAIHDMLENINRTNELQFVTDWQGIDETLLSDKLKLTLFRITQEQVNNIIKHANATMVTIEITKLEESLQLSIKDNGVGFDTYEKRKGVGLQNIASRTELSHGTVVINSHLGAGCELIVDFQL